MRLLRSRQFDEQVRGWQFVCSLTRLSSPRPTTGWRVSPLIVRISIRSVDSNSVPFPFASSSLDSMRLEARGLAAVVRTTGSSSRARLFRASWDLVLRRIRRDGVDSLCKSLAAAVRGRSDHLVRGVSVRPILSRLQNLGSGRMC